MTQAKNIMVSSYARTKEASQAKYISILNIIQGEVDPTQVSWHSCKISVLVAKLVYIGLSQEARKIMPFGLGGQT
jgi:hypothetical protein